MPRLSPVWRITKAGVRRTAVSSLAQALEEIDRKLLFRDLDGQCPFLDPRQPIPETISQKAVSKLELVLGEVQARYEAIAE